MADHGARVLRVCRAVVGPDDADDAWSETFLSALRAYPDLAADADVGAWLATIAYRKCLDSLRARSRRPAPLAEMSDFADGAAVALRRPETEAGDTVDEVYDALRALPDKQRLAVAYHHLGGWSFAQTAAILGGSEAAARKASSDGVRTLRRILTSPSTQEHP